MSNTNAFLTQITDALGHVSKNAYDACTGLLRQQQNPNDLAAGRNGTITSYDEMGNENSVQYPDQGSTTTLYGYTQSPVTITRTTAATPDPSVSTETDLDGYGRIAHQKITSDLAGADTVDTAYDSVGRVQSVSNPHRPGDSTYGTTTYAYDALGRKVTQTQPGGNATLQWCYYGVTNPGQSTCPSNLSNKSLESWADAWDELGNHSQQVTDGLGRLVAVMEPNASNTPAWETDYAYDLNDNLMRVARPAPPRTCRQGC